MADNRIAERKWMCFRCGYAMDGYSRVDTGAAVVAKEGDVSVCMNCGAVFMRHGANWCPITRQEREELEPGALAVLARLLAARALAIRENLAKKDGRA